MLNTIKATLLPTGMLTFEEALPLDHPIPVLVTLLEERPAANSRQSAAVDGKPLDWQPASEEPARTELWRHLTTLREQAIAEGMKLLDWDEIEAEVRSRRGGVSDE